MASVVFLTDFSESYARDLMLGIARYSHDVGEAWTICRFPLSFRDSLGIGSVVEHAKKIKADAIIGQFYDTDDMNLFREAGIIAVAQDFRNRFASLINITGEYFRAGELGADYLIRKGFVNFAFYGIPDVVWSEERKIGFRKRLQEVNPDYTFSEFLTSGNVTWNYDIESTCRWLVNLPKPVAIMACDDNHAYYITEACRIISIDQGNRQVRIPEDIAILGVDNDESICRLSSPNLSSISQFVEQGGYKVAETIDSIISGQIKMSEVEDIVVRVGEVIPRQSTDIFVNDDPHITKILRYIHENITDKISVDDLVQQVPLSRRLLEIRFHKAMGTSIYDYIIRTRVDCVAHGLNEGLRVAEAAAAIGITDVKNLSRAFKRIKGVTPSEYWKLKHKCKLEKE